MLEKEKIWQGLQLLKRKWCPSPRIRINIFSQNPCSHQLVQLLTLQVLDYTPTAKALQESSPTTTVPQENTLSAKGLKEYLPTVKALREYSAARAHPLYGVLECSPAAKVLLESSPTTTAQQVNYLLAKVLQEYLPTAKALREYSAARSPQFSPVFKALEYFPIHKAPEYFPIVKVLWHSPKLPVLGYSPTVKALGCPPIVKVLQHSPALPVLDYFPTVKALGCPPTVSPLPCLVGVLLTFFI